jgi:hypothetical protein
MTDKLEITELLYRYADPVDSGDFDGVGRLLARASFGGANTPSGSGAANIAGLFGMTTRRFPAGFPPRSKPRSSLGQVSRGTAFCQPHKRQSVG